MVPSGHDPLGWRCRAQHGFTMIELMVTIAIAAILLAIGVPSFNQVMVNARTSTLANDVTSAINLARSEAVRRAEAVSVCPSNNGTSCSGSWTDGWITIVDSSSEVLRSWRTPTPTADIAQTPTADDEIEFGPLGQRVTGNTALVLQVNGCAGDRARRLEIGPAGRVSVQRVACT